MSEARRRPQDWFTEHPASVGETYVEHLGHACRFGLRLMAGGAACLLHGLCPFLFTNTASRMIDDLHQRIRRGRP